MPRGRGRSESLAGCYGSPRLHVWRFRLRNLLRAIHYRASDWAALDRSPGDMALSYGLRAVVVGLLGTLVAVLAVRSLVTGAVAVFVAPHPELLVAVNLGVTAAGLLTLAVR